MLIQPGLAAPQPIHVLQILRAVAAFLVVVRHCTKPFFDDGFEVGQFGVDMFFVISGFVIYLTGRNQPAPTFAVKRLVRIAPLYWLVLGFVVLGELVRGNHPGVAHTLLSFAFLPSVGPNGAPFPPLTVGWTLNFEMFFYAAFTCVLFVVNGPRLLITLTCGFVLLVFAGLVVDVSPLDYPVSVFALPIVLEFVAGMWLARFWIDGTRPGFPMICVLMVAAIAWLAFASVQNAYSFERGFWWGIPAIAIIWAALGLEHRIDFARYRSAILLGDASYALYLAHPVIIAIALVLIGSLSIAVPAEVVVIGLIGASLIAGLSLHLLIERPMLSALRAMMGRRKPKLLRA